jgi:hypothetical protein
MQGTELNSGAKFDNLAAAIAAALPNDTLRVKGTCHGTFTLR